MHFLGTCEVDYFNGLTKSLCYKNFSVFMKKLFEFYTLSNNGKNTKKKLSAEIWFFINIVLLSFATKYF